MDRGRLIGKVFGRDVIYGRVKGVIKIRLEWRVRKRFRFFDNELGFRLEILERKNVIYV